MKDYLNSFVNANQIRGMAVLNGTLHFLKDGIVFKAQSVNSMINYPIIAYKDIIDIKKKNTFGLIPNGLTICSRNGEEQHYVVLHRNEIITFLENEIKHSKE